MGGLDAYALLSGLVFPGAGHLVLKRYVSAFLLCTVSFVALSVIVHHVMLMASVIVDKFLSGAVPADTMAITALMTNSDADSNTAEVAQYVLLACWVIGIVDSYRIGGMRDKAEP